MNQIKSKQGIQEKSEEILDIVVIEYKNAVVPRFYKNVKIVRENCDKIYKKETAYCVVL